MPDMEDYEVDEEDIPENAEIMEVLG